MSHVLENYGISLVCSRICFEIVEVEESRKNPVEDVELWDIFGLLADLFWLIILIMWKWKNPIQEVRPANSQ